MQIQRVAGCYANQLHCGQEAKATQLYIGQCLQQQKQLSEGNPSRSVFFLKSKGILGFQVIARACAAYLCRKASRNNSMGQEETVLEVNCDHQLFFNNISFIFFALSVKLEETIVYDRAVYSVCIGKTSGV